MCSYQTIEAHAAAELIDLPKLALSVRQPWAWAIIHIGKDIESRDWKSNNPNLRYRGRIALHAAKGTTASCNRTASRGCYRKC
jgi:hypothetical protein